MKIHKATRKYEQWLGRQITLLPRDLEHKHQEMSKALFPFLRATFYRWMQLWPQKCPGPAAAPVVLAVGDLHVENFGTWRDIEGRLVWGINDFDEAYRLPYTLDLVRLAVSAHVAIAENGLSIGPKDACNAILAGYTESVEKGGKAFVLAEHHGSLRNMAIGELRDPVAYWKKLDLLPGANRVPHGVRKNLERMLPERGLTYRVAHRIAGLGSLGRERFAALAEWRGGKVAREAKALAPSACVWARGEKGSARIRYQEILDRAVRCPDPFVKVGGRWVVRRLAPDCSRIELTSIPKQRDESRLLYAMGWETGNIHLGSKNIVQAVHTDLKKRPRDWLHAAARTMIDATKSDWEVWRKGKID